MIAIADLRALAEARLLDANVLFAHGRFDSAYYLCGYAVELALKARICMTLNWEGYPEKGNEFDYLASLKTHRLRVLLGLSGQQARITTHYSGDWTSLKNWNPEVRYRRVGSADPQQVAAMLGAAERLLEVL
jgi:HEPN domain